MFAVRMSVKAFELVPAIERINLLSEKASTQVCHFCTQMMYYLPTYVYIAEIACHTNVE